MRTRARAWAVRAAVVAVVTAASIVGITTPAFAADVEVHSFSMSPSTIEPGQESTARFTVQLIPDDAGSVNLTVTSNNPKVECISGCSVGGAQIDEGGTEFEAKFRATGLFTSEQTVTITVQATDTSGGPTKSASQPLRVRASPTVPEVRGTVTDVNTGEPVEGARVGMTDSAGTVWDNIGTDANGNFRIPGTSDKPIAAGELRFTVQKEGIREYTSGPITAVAGKALTDVPLKVQVLPTASATSLPPLTPSDLSTPEETSAVAAPPDTGLSGFSIMLIVIGGLLVLVGIAAIVLLFIRRNNDDAGGPPRGPGMGGRGGPGRMGPPGPRRPGPPDRTQPMRPGYGPPRPGVPGARDQTMIARSPLADAPTQMHGRPGAPQPPYSGPPAYPSPPPGGRTPPPPPGHGQAGYAGPPPGPAAGYPPQPGYGPPRPAPGGYDDPRQAGRHTSEGRRVDWMDD